MAAQVFFFVKELRDPNINKDPIYATSRNVGLVNDKGVKSKAETHLKSSLALHSCDHFEFSSGSLMNTFMIHDHYVLLSWHLYKPGIIQFPILQIFIEQQPCVVVIRAVAPSLGPMDTIMNMPLSLPSRCSL